MIDSSTAECAVCRALTPLHSAPYPIPTPHGAAYQMSPMCPGKVVPHTLPSCWRDPSHGVPYQLADSQLIYIIKQQDKFLDVSPVLKSRLLLGL
jgi:hypothetical protein